MAINVCPHTNTCPVGVQARENRTYWDTTMNGDPVCVCVDM